MEFVDSKPENIWVAAADGDLSRIVELLNEGVSVNAQDSSGYSPLHAAASYAQLNIVEFLVANGAEVNIMDSDGDTPLLFCEDPETFELLLRLGANPVQRNFQNEGIFEKALEEENIVLIQYLAANGLVDNEIAATAIARLQNEESNEAGEEDEEEGGINIEIDCAEGDFAEDDADEAGDISAV